MWYIKVATLDWTHTCQHELVPGLLMLFVVGRGKIELGSYNVIVIASHHHPRANMQNGPLLQAQYGNM
jgi:hypothetical protein